MQRIPRKWVVRGVFLAFTALAMAIVWVTNEFLTERYIENTRNRAEVRLALYSGNLISELQRASIVPLLLSRDPALTGALNANDYVQTSQRLISYVDEIGVASLMLLDREGRTVAASNREILGSGHRGEPYMIQALRSNETVFTTSRDSSGAFQFRYSRKVADSGQEPLGVIVVSVDLRKFEQSWAGFSDAVFVTDSEGTIILSTEARWRAKTEEEALALQSPPGAISRALQATADWTTPSPDAYLLGEGVMRQDTRIPFQGWRMTSFTTYASVRERVNGVLALEIMGFALLLAAGFYTTSRRAVSRSAFLQRESAELKRLNTALQREIAVRERVEKNLQVAEQTVAQTSKLAILGEMSAAVSHELNQPLAAMKTYLAGARLLLQRQRPVEALASFQRIDDLIERMGSITRQLKSFARKEGDADASLDLRACVTSALSMMEPQLRASNVAVRRTLPQDPVMIRGDKVRVEQVIINLLSNAVDATRSVSHPEIELLLAAGESAVLTVRDNGHGIEDLESLFEPFYTTKAPGEGVGLGLAISSEIVSDLGGRLTARNSASGGAVFELGLPLDHAARTAAE